MTYFSRTEANNGVARLLTVLIVLVSIATAVGSGAILARFLDEEAKLGEVHAANALALRKAENVLKNADGLLRELHQNRLTNCNDGTLHAIRLHAFRETGIRDVRVTASDGAILCSANEAVLGFDTSWPALEDMHQVGHSDRRIFPIDHVFGSSVGLFTKTGADSGLVAVMTLSPEEFDVLPAPLRAGSHFTIKAQSGQPLMSVGSALGNHLLHFEERSETWPIRVHLGFTAMAFDAWSPLPWRPILAGSGFAGLLLGLALARLLVRPENPLLTIDRAISAGEFKPYLQPVIDLATGEVTGAEILCRRITATGQVIGPGHFIDLAESTGRIQTITHQILDEALIALRREMDRNPHFRLSVNIAPTHFMHPNFETDMTRLCVERGVRSEQVVFELTERQAFQDLKAAREKVDAVHKRGFKVALDDVGIGQSGLSQIQALGADVLKIDKFFIDAINRDMSARVIIQMLVKIAEEMGSTLIAEGVESGEQRVALLACSVSRAQGYHYAQPLPVNAFLAYLAQHRARHAEVEAFEDAFDETSDCAADAA